MKHTGKCPKCSGTEIIRMANMRARSVISGSTVFTAICCVGYICGGCGFIEEYVESADLAKLIKRTRNSE